MSQKRNLLVMMQVTVYDEPVEPKNSHVAMNDSRLLMEVENEDSFDAWFTVLKDDPASEVYKHKHIFLKAEDGKVVRYWFLHAWLPQPQLMRLVPEPDELAAELKRLRGL